MSHGVYVRIPIYVRVYIILICPQLYPLYRRGLSSSEKNIKVFVNRFYCKICILNTLREIFVPLFQFGCTITCEILTYHSLYIERVQNAMPMWLLDFDYQSTISIDKVPGEYKPLDIYRQNWRCRRRCRLGIGVRLGRFPALVAWRRPRGYDLRH